MKVGHILYEAGDTVDRIYFLESGLVTLVTTMHDGRDVETTSRGRDGGIGYLEAVGSGTLISRAVVQIRGEAFCVPASVYRELYERSRGLRSLVNRRTELLLADARQASACRATHPAAQRLARMLLECVLHTGRLRLRLTQEFMAGMIGVGRTTVTRAAGDLQDAGLIRYRRGVIYVVDHGGLRRRACECYEAFMEARERILETSVTAAPQPSRPSTGPEPGGHIRSESLP